MQGHPLSLRQSPLQDNPVALQQSPLQSHPMSLQQQSPLQSHPMSLHQQSPIEDHPLPLHQQSPLQSYPMTQHQQSPIEDHPMQQSPLQEHPLQNHPLLHSISDPSTQGLSQAELDNNPSSYQNHQSSPFGSHNDPSDPSSFDFEDESSLLPSTITDFSVATRSAPVPSPLLTLHNSISDPVGN